MAQSISLWGATYSNVPAVNLPKSTSGTARFTDTSVTTAVESDVASGKIFIKADGSQATGTNQGGSGDGYVWQDAQGYVHLSDEEGTQPIVDSLTVSGSGTYTAQTGHVYNPVIVPSGSASPASTISATGATVSAGTNTLTLSKSVSNTPSVSAGYVSSGTSGNSSVSLTASVNTRSSSDLTASGATVTAPAGYYGSSATKTVDSMTLPTSASSTSTGTRKATISASTSTQYINIPTGYNSANAYYQLSAPSAMTLPTTTSGTSTGTLKATVTPSTANKYINIPTGYNSANAYYTVSGDANLVASNIKNGTTIFGVTGSYTGGGGGSSNVVAGTFTTGSGGSAQTINLSYSGNGFPIAVSIMVSEGTYNSSGTAYSTIQQYGVLGYTMIKTNMTTPTYSYNGSGNNGSRYFIFKSSSTTASTLSGNNSSNQSDVYSQYTASSSTWDVVVLVTSNTTLSVYVSNTSGTRGLLANTEYYYSVLYSE